MNTRCRSPYLNKT